MSPHGILSDIYVLQIKWKTIYHAEFASHSRDTIYFDFDIKKPKKNMLYLSRLSLIPTLLFLSGKECN